MLFLLKTVFITALCFVGEIFFPWWIIAVGAFLGGALVPTKAILSFLSGFLGVGLLWLIYAWILDLRATSIISQQIAPLLQLEQPSYLILATALLGGIVGGFGSLSGDLFVKLLPKREEKYH